jgi:PAS domain S-box-containing protein
MSDTMGGDVTVKTKRHKEYDKVFSNAFIENIPGSVSITDASGRLVWWNAFFRDEIFGKPDCEMLNTDAITGFHPDDRKFALKSIQNVFEFGIDVSAEGRFFRRGGPKFQWHMITNRRIMIDGNPFVLLFGIDITERKRYEAITAFSLRLIEMVENCSVEELLKATLDEAERLTESSVGFFHFVSDAQSTFSRVVSTNMNSKGQGWDGNEGCFSLHVEKSANVLMAQNALMCNYATQGSSNTCGGEMSQVLFVPLMRGAAVVAIICVGDKQYDYDEDDSKMVEALANLALDIVDRKRVMLSKQKIEEILFQAQKMELVGQLAGGIAHDFNNMMGVILDNVEMALNQDHIEEPLSKNLKAILKATEHSAELTGQLLAFSREQSVMPIVFTLNLMVEKALAILIRLIGENIALVWVPDSLSTSVKIDPTQIEMILGNLCVNSRDAITGNGRITIATHRIYLDEAACKVNHTCKKPGHYVQLVVTDDGCGIENKVLPHIFEPFFTTKKLGKGTGMGLSTIYGIVKQSNAYVDCQSEKGKGTTFNIYFPWYQGYADPDNSKQQAPSISSDKKTILLVEDEPDLLNICRRMLECKGYSVLSAATFGEAIRIAAENKGDIHLLMTDVVLPEINGCDLSKKIKLISPNIKTLFMSGYSAEIASCHTELNCREDFIQKPFSINTLFVALQKILGSHD